MALINSDVIPASATTFEIEQSLRFNDDDSAYLSWTPSSAGNQKTWTWSGWIKRGNIGLQNHFFSAGTGSSPTFLNFGFNASDELQVLSWDYNFFETSQLFRDTSNWYHIVIVLDTSNSTASDRMRVYVNGNRVTNFSQDQVSNISQNQEFAINSTTQHEIGRASYYSSKYQEGYLAEVHFIDGQALDPSYFGETGDYGEWKPIEYTGTYGTNGFYLPFKNDYEVEGFSTVTWRGNVPLNGDGTNYIGGTGFQPDLIWIKARTSGDHHNIFDAVRGTTGRLQPNQAGLEYPVSYLSSFENDGFLLNGDSSATNRSGTDYVAWNWDMGDFEYSELLTNGDFSTGSTSGWTTELGSYNVIKYKDNYVLDPATNGDSFLTQEVSVTAGTDYIVRAVIPKYTSGNVWLYVYDSDYTDYNSRGTNLGGGAQTDADAYFIKVTPTGSTMTIMVSTNGTQDWYMDNISVRQANEDGSSSSLVVSNPTYGQSIVGYIGNSTSGATIGHGLSSAPEMIMLKSRSGNYTWIVYHKDMITNPEQYYMELQGTGLPNDYGFWNDTAPTSSVFSLGNFIHNNNNGDKYVAYCFHSVSGYSKIGSYTGNGGTQTITTGFRPAFILAKSTSNAMDWVIIDNVRSPSGDSKRLYPNTTDTEETNSTFIFTDTGFQTVDSSWNNSGYEFIYMAFADKREFAYWLDQSGNNNDWTSNNLTESDISVDSPTNNFATLNSLTHNGITTVLSEGNLKNLTGSTSGYSQIRPATIPMSSGKWYFEYVLYGTYNYGNISLIDPTNSSYFSMMNSSTVGRPSNYATGFTTQNSGTTYIYGQSNVSTPSISNGTVGHLCVDVDSGKVWVGSGGTWYNSGNPATGTNPTATLTGYNELIFLSSPTDSGSQYYVHNFGQDSSFAGNKTAQGNTDSNNIGDFYYTPPSGYLALCTANLSDPAVIPSEHFNTVTWTGNDTYAGRSITGVGFQPDFVWAKARSQGYSPIIYDVLRGTGSTAELATDQNIAEGGSSTSERGYLNSFDSDGFSSVVGSSSDNLYFNQSSQTYVAWNWKANGSGVSNTNGSITSTVSANQDAGFSIVSYTGTGANATVGHGLSQAPEMLIVKSRSDSSNNWMVYAKPEGNTDYAHLNLTNAFGSASTVWQNTTPTSSVFSIGTANGVNQNTYNFIAYAFHSVDGFSKVGSYTGNASSDGPFVYTGFRPAFVIIKNADNSVQGWTIQDAERSTYNEVDNYLLAQASSAEQSTYAKLDFLSNGFKIRTSDALVNGSGNNIIYMCFAENPFKYTNAR